MKNSKLVVAVIGGNKCSPKTARLARRLGKEIARMGAVLVCGGLGGVMEQASRGAKEAGGLTVGILPTEDKKDANAYIDIAIPTDLGYARNCLVVRASDCVVAFPGEYGTLSEIAFALQMNKPIIGLNTWDIPGVLMAKDMDDCIEKIKELTHKADPVR
jgi:hypothetical protein